MRSLLISTLDLLPLPPPRQVVRTAFGIAMGLYLATGTAGYIAVGDSVGSDILVEFENGSVPG